MVPTYREDGLVYGSHCGHLSSPAGEVASEHVEAVHAVAVYPDHIVREIAIGDGEGTVRGGYRSINAMVQSLESGAGEVCRRARDTHRLDGRAGPGNRVLGINADDALTKLVALGDPGLQVLEVATAEGNAVHFPHAHMGVEIIAAPVIVVHDEVAILEITAVGDGLAARRGVLVGDVTHSPAAVEESGTDLSRRALHLHHPADHIPIVGVHGLDGLAGMLDHGSVLQDYHALMGRNWIAGLVLDRGAPHFDARPEGIVAPLCLGQCSFIDDHLRTLVDN